MARLTVAALSIASANCASTQAPGTPGSDPGGLQAAQKSAQTIPDDARASFRAALDAYVAVRRKVEEQLPKIPAAADPAAVHAHEQRFEKLIATARAGAKEGDVFTPAIQPHLRRICRELLSGPGGSHRLEEIREEAAERPLAARVNERYPDAIPVSSVPAALLTGLPKLPQDLEYRFLGNDLILLDTGARMIVDFIRGVLPR
jgi:hypothetical protein